MAVDFFVALPCAPKQHFGAGDCASGALDILERIKSKNRGDMIAQIVAKNGQDPATVKITVNGYDRDKRPIKKEVTLAELAAEAQPLEEQGAACATCPANLLGKPYGCVGCVNYPVPAAAEKWLLSRVQPFGSVGAFMCQEFMTDFKVDGQPIRRMRKNGLFASPRGEEVVFKKSFFSKTSVTADQLLQTILAAGDELNPGHCFGILLWLGAIKVDGKVPGTVADDRARIQTLMGLQTREDKERHTALELGPPASNPDEELFQKVVRALYVAWVHDVGVVVSA